ncbi:MAG: hypothetical protein Q4G43_08525 [Mobilicoccus sp.]|nr:hypothetical protein [Mobilicoccus sp.]
MTSSPTRPMVDAAPRKSLLLSALLTFFLGPFGMFYTTWLGTIVMIVLSVPLLLLTMGAAWAGIVPIAMIWGVWAGHRYNERQRRIYSARGGW